MKVFELVRLLEELAPPRYGCDWDNIGLLLGAMADEVTAIYLTLDCDDSAVSEAIAAGCDFILSHHPVIFGKLRKITDEDAFGRKLLHILRHGIACYGMHTSFDAAPGCMADLTADRLGLTDTSVLLETVPGEGIGRVGLLPRPMSVAELCCHVKEAFHLPSLTLYEAVGRDERISRVAILPGSGRGEIPLAAAAGAQAYITGDVTHHDALDAVEMGLTILDAGHYGTEWIFMDKLAQYLSEALPKDVRLVRAPLRFPGQVV